jgi:hypothetical protein
MDVENDAVKPKYIEELLRLLNKIIVTNTNEGNLQQAVPSGFIEKVSTLRTVSKEMRKLVNSVCNVLASRMKQAASSQDEAKASQDKAVKRKQTFAGINGTCPDDGKTYSKHWDDIKPKFSAKKRIKLSENKADSESIIKLSNNNNADSVNNKNCSNADLSVDCSNSSENTSKPAKKRRKNQDAQN